MRRHVTISTSGPAGVIERPSSKDFESCVRVVRLAVHETRVARGKILEILVLRGTFHDRENGCVLEQDRLRRGERIPVVIVDQRTHRDPIGRSARKDAADAQADVVRFPVPIGCAVTSSPGAGNAPFESLPAIERHGE
jgi:hypothetical protein